MSGEIRVLIVDDEPELREMLSIMFENRYQIHSVSNGKEGLVALENDKYDCVLCDIAMPKMDGIAFIKEVRRRGMNVPFIFFTAYATKDHMIETLKYGAFDFIGKPRYEGLADSINRAVRMHSLEHHVEEESFADEYQKVIEDISSGSLRKILFIGAFSEEKKGELESLLKERLVMVESLDNAIQTLQDDNIGLIVSELVFDGGTVRELYRKLTKGKVSRSLFLILPEDLGCDVLFESNGKDLFFWREVGTRSFLKSVYSALQEASLKSEACLSRYVRLRVKKLLLYDFKKGMPLYVKDCEQRYVQISQEHSSIEEFKESIRKYQGQGLKFLYLDKNDYIDLALDCLEHCCSKCK